MMTERCGFQAVALTIGGVTGVLAPGGWNNFLSNLSNVEFYNPGTDSWMSVAAMNVERAGSTGANVSIAGVAGALVCGGNFSLPASTEFFDPIANSWTLKASMIGGRESAAAAPVTVSGVAGVLVTGGSSASTLSTAEFYNPVTNQWSARASMSTPRAFQASAPVTIGGATGVIVAGGYDGATALSSAEFYDPGADAWIPLAPMSAARSGAAAVPLTIGGVAGVVVAGGADTTYLASASAEFYNPVSNTWTALPAMSVSRAPVGGAVVSIGGKAGILVAGGCGAGGGLAGDRASAEFFCP